MFRSVTLWGGALLCSALLLVVGIGLTPPAALVAARSLMFSKFVADDSVSQQQLNDGLAARSAAVDDPREYRRLVNPQVFTALLAFARQHAQDSTALAREIVRRMSPGRPTTGCGQESLGEKVEAATRRYGCCSDYTAAFLVYAGALGLPARRVENQIHTTAEYFDRHTGSWVWVDPMYREQATDTTGRLLSQFDVRRSMLAHKPVRIIELYDPPVAAHTRRELYDEAQYAIAYWYPRTDLVAIDDFDARLRAFHLPRPIRQMAAFWRGVRTEPTGIASPELVHRLRVGAWLAWGTLALLGMVELAIAFVFVTRCARLLQERLTRPADRFGPPQFAETNESK